MKRNKMSTRAESVFDGQKLKDLISERLNFKEINWRALIKSTSLKLAIPGLAIVAFLALWGGLASQVQTSPLAHESKNGNAAKFLAM